MMKEMLILVTIMMLMSVGFAAENTKLGKFGEEFKMSDGSFMGASLRSPEGQSILILKGSI